MPARLRTALLAALGLLVALFAPLAVAMPAQADVNDFDYASWDATYEVGVDADGRSVLHVTETLVARFPETDQNRGIVRGLPEKYDGAPISPTVLSIRDDRGENVPYETDSENDVLLLALGDDQYRHGLTTYVIEYTMRDVFHEPEDAAIDEFYWDLLPLDSTQPIESFTGTIRFDDALAARATGESSCYQGTFGAKGRCEVLPDGTSPGTFTVTAADLRAGEGVTVAFAFAPGTVVPSPAKQPDARTDVLPYALAGGGIVVASAAGFGARAALRRRHRAQGRGVIVAQYDVPDDLSPLLAGTVLGTGGAKQTPAEIAHLGVRGVLRIEEQTGKPALTLLDASAAPDPLDAAATTALFGAGPQAGTIYLAVPDNTVATAVAALPGSARAAAVERGLLVRRRSPLAPVFGLLGVLGGLAGIAMSIPGMIVGREAAIAAFVVSIILTIALLVLAAVLFLKQHVLTPKGAETWEYLQGVREYIRLAEADRIRMLQSYRGAERREDGGADVIVLYERLLPYAMLFGLEKEWGEVLAVEYERLRHEPDWYTGYAYGSIGSSLAHMGGTLSPTPTATSSSSSSGSFGGGFSGGGGGGGFSGGR
ncbi:putative membrane protein YgcG [Microbacterium resistens]|uniref:Membrane protein YgcG n=1 Tax=Microbacterium resistens TaxID=156977 RepID=A0ABU1SFB5_9MICO|nr:DUF2207 domain-containing protein [Microbacterium resistens]MDR6868303.1 putative membrane protein YgcG [Microbacterium resistens]